MSNRSVGMGTAALVLGELQRSDREARHAYDAANNAMEHAQSESDRANRAEANYKQLLFSAQSQVHGFRARIEAHICIENQVIAALQVADPNNPLCDREVVEYLVDTKRDELMYSKEVLQKTYLEGVAPEGSIPLVNGGPGVKGGLPANPSSAAKRAERLALTAAMAAHNLSFEQVFDPVIVAAAIERQQARATELKDVLDRDATKSFFTSMGKKKRSEVEGDYKTALIHLGALEKAFVDAMQFVEDMKVREEKRVRVEAKLKKLGNGMK